MSTWEAWNVGAEKLLGVYATRVEARTKMLAEAGFMCQDSSSVGMACRGVMTVRYRLTIDIDVDNPTATTIGDLEVAAVDAALLVRERVEGSYALVDDVEELGT
jgi:hypothetical protein